MTILTIIAVVAFVVVAAVVGLLWLEASLDPSVNGDAMDKERRK